MFGILDGPKILMLRTLSMRTMDVFPASDPEPRFSRKGLQVVATDVAPNENASLKRFVPLGNAAGLRMAYG